MSITDLQKMPCVFEMIEVVIRKKSCY